MKRNLFSYELRSFPVLLLATAFLCTFENRLLANPTGGIVAGGSATISTSGSVSTINQSSNAAIINWKSFSINPGETTRFVQPNSQSAALNRVLGGSTSLLNGTLTANGQVYLINQNGIVVGPSGIINTAGFTASTRDITDSGFLNGKRHFVGNGSGSVVNQGSIKGQLGDVVLIGKTVSNSGSIKASGTVGLEAGDDILLGQRNPDGSTITVNPSPLASSASGRVGVSNCGSIHGTAVELKAADGNIYSLAIQNEGIIRASTLKRQGGQIWLTSDTGTISNSGTLNASATRAGGHGGSVIVKNTGGTTIDSGKIIAKGGKGGYGGNAEVSGVVVRYSGTVDLTAPDGATGDVLFDPYNVSIQNGTATGNSNFAAAGNDSVFYTGDLETALVTANVTVTTGTSGTQQGDITVANAVAWAQNTTLSLTAANNIYLNADISAPIGGLNLSAGSNILTGSESSSGSILANVAVNSFILSNGSWMQNASTLPSFNASNDFELNGTSSFLRVAGGGGTTGSPYQITDVYELQGVGSPSHAYLGNSFVLNNNIEASGTATWNSGVGFVPIGGSSTFSNPYTGTFNGAGNVISGLTINRPSQNYIGLFGYTGPGSVIENVGLMGGSVSGKNDVGGLVGFNDATVESSYVTGGVTGINVVGGLVGLNAVTVESSYSTGVVNGGGGGEDAGGLVGYNNGTLETSYATGVVNGGSASYSVGGLVGDNGGTLETSYATGVVNGGNGSNFVGGLAGGNFGTLETSYATGAVNGGSGTYVGGLVGEQGGVVTANYWAQDTGLNVGLFGIGSNASNSGATPETLANLKLQSTFTPTGTAANQWDFTTPVWTTNGDTTAPLLRVLSVNLSGNAVAGGDTVDLISSGKVLYTTTAGAGGAYGFYVPDDVVTGGALLTDVTGTHNADAYYVTGAIPSTSITGVNLSSNLLNVEGTGEARNTALGTAAGSLTNKGIDYTVTSANLSTISGVGITIGTTYYLDGNLTATGATLSTTAIGSLNGTGASVTVSANTINLSGTVSHVGTVAVNTGSFILSNGSWVQNGSLPGFTDTGDFELNGTSSFLRVAGGSGTTDSPYQITDVYGLQGVGSPSNVYLGNSFVLNNNIDASGTATWNSSAGFVPIGGSFNETNAYNGTFNGVGNVISDLTINRLSQNYIGLFGYTGSGSVIDNVGMTGGSVSGNMEVGGLVGENDGTVQASYSTGVVNGRINNFNYVGGLVGYNGSTGTIEKSYATGVVNGGRESYYAGGLVGENDGTVEMSYATEVVNASGSFGVGGLVGINDGTIETSYATGVVNGVGIAYVGGLVGLNHGTVETSYATVMVDGVAESEAVGGLVGFNFGTVTANYWAKDTGLNATLNGTANAGNTGATPETLANLMLQSTFSPAGTGSTNWNFTLGTGVWGINGYTSTGLINNGMPYFQWQYPTQAQIVPTSQTLVYSRTTGTLNQALGTAYSVNYASGYSSLSGLLSAGPTFSAVGSNVNVGSTNAVGVALTVNSGDTVEVQNNGATVSYTPATLTITGAVANNKVYDSTTADTLNNSSSTLSGIITGDTVNLVSTSATGTFASKDVANGITVTTSGYTLSGAQASDYTVTGPMLSANITPATLTITGAVANNKVYDRTTAETLNNSSSTLSGVYSGDMVSLVSTGATGTFANQNVGTGISVSTAGYTLSGAQSNDYMLTAPTLSANITPATLTITGAVANNKVYDSTTAETLNNSSSTLSGIITGDTVNLVSTSATGTFAGKDVANGITVTTSGYSLSGAQSSDYMVTGPTLSANITPATLTITGAVANNKVYDSTTADTLNNSSSALSGVYSGDTVNLVSTGTTGKFANQNVGTGISVSTAGYTLSGAQSNDYMLTAPTLSANITPATLTITGAVANNKVYDSTTADTLNNSSSTLSGIITGDTVNLVSTSATGTFASKDVANGITVTTSGYTLSGAQASDYTVTGPMLSANITPATLTITGAIANNKTYDSTTADTLDNSSSALSGVYSGDTVNLVSTASTGTFASKDVANGITVTTSGYTLSGAQASDYTVTGPMLSANITPATLTITGAIANNKTYDSTTADTLDNSSSALSGVYSGETVNLVSTASTGTFASKDVANGITVTTSGYTLSGAQASDYTVTGPMLRANITPATLTITGAIANNKTYDSTTADTLDNSSSALSGVYSGDTVNLVSTASTGTFASKDVANGVTVTTSGYTVSGAQASDYTVTGPTLSANITPATLTYLANPIDIVAGSVIPPLQGSVTGFIGGDNLANATTGHLLYTTNASTTLSPGNFGIFGSGLSSQDYEFVQALGNLTALTIAPSPVISPVFATPENHLVLPNPDPYIISFETSYKAPFISAMIQSHLYTVDIGQTYPIFGPGYSGGGGSISYGNEKENPGSVITFGSSYTEAHSQKK